VVPGLKGPTNVLGRLAGEDVDARRPSAEVHSAGMDAADI